MFNFEKLDVWQVAVGYADDIYRVTRAFPDDEKFGLRSQMRRSAVSISANLAEGSAKSSNKEFVRFMQIAFASLMETVSHLEISRRQSFLAPEAHQELYELSERLGKMISGLRQSLINRTTN